MIDNNTGKPVLATFKVVLISTLIGLILYYLIGFGFLPTQFDFESVSFWELIKLILIDQFLVEAVYFYLLLKALEYYAQIIKYNATQLAQELLKFIPFFGLIFFLVNPVTQSIRYLLRYGFQFEKSVYLNEYLFSPSLYVVYTVFGSIIGISVMILRSRNKPEPESNITRLIGEHEAVMKPVDMTEIYWVEVENRKYWVTTVDKRLRINETLSTLENELDGKMFVRINRSVIVNINFIDSYSPLGNGIYHINMKTPRGREFSVSRKRSANFKKVIGKEL